MILLIAQLDAKPGAGSEVNALLEDLLQTTRQESGCVFSSLNRSDIHAETFLTCELYADRRACDAHLTSPEMLSALQRLKHLLLGPPLVTLGETLAAAIGSRSYELVEHTDALDKAPLPERLDAYAM